MEKNSISFFIFGYFALILSLIEEPYIIGILTALFLLYYFFSSSNRFKFDTVHPFQIYSLFAFLTTLSNLQQEWKVLNQISLEGYAYANPNFFFSASIIWFWGNFFFIFGFEFFRKIQVKPFFYKPKTKYHLFITFLLSLAIVFSQRFFPISLPGTIGSFFYLIPILSIFFFARLGYVIKNNTIINYGYILMIVHTILGVLFGYLRFEFIISGIVFILGSYFGQKNLKFFLSVRYLPLLFLAIFFVSIFGYFGNNRSQLSYGLNRITELNKEVFSEKIKTQENHFSAFDRISVIAQLSKVVEISKKKEKNYLKETIYPIVVAFFPRFLWPEKPKIALGVWFALEIGQSVKTKAWYSNSINMTTPGHLYLGLGWIGLTIGIFFIGLFLKFIWTHSDFKNPSNLPGGMLAGYLFYMAVQGFGADLQFFVTLIAIFLLFKLINFILPKNENTLYRTTLERK